MNFRTIYNHDRAISALFATINKETSLTQQSDTNDTDINIIVGRFMKTGQLPQTNAKAIAGDFTSGMDFRTAMDRLNEAKEAFNSLPAKLRSRFDNDPEQFIEFATDPENLPELRKLGLANPEEEKRQWQPPKQTGAESTPPPKPSETSKPEKQASPASPGSSAP